MPERMRQVVHNLLAHALAMHAGGRQRARGMPRPRGVRRDRRARQRHGHSRRRRCRTCSIRSGRCITHARSRRAPAGVWLGLAVSHRIVELHGGRIFVVSEGESRGAVFIVRLPVAIAAGALPPVRSAKLRNRRAGGGE